MNQKPKASTQQHLDLEDIQDDLVILKSGWVSLILSTTSLNFDLLSEAEQDSTIYAYGAFLNSLTFPIQILVRSKKADISAYFSLLSEAESTQTNPDLKKQMQKYRDFLSSIIQQKTVLDKSFYMIINYNPLERGVKAGLGKTNISGKKNKIQLLIDAKGSLFPKRDHITKQVGRLGISATQLSTKKLIELFYDIYNPAPTGTQRVILDSASYTVPIVGAAIEVPTKSPQQENIQPSPPSAPSQSSQAYQPINAPQAQPINTQQQNTPSLPQIAQPQNLRPVPPKTNKTAQDQQPSPAPQTTIGQSKPAAQTVPNVNPQIQPDQQPASQNTPTPQIDALRDLQEATAKAAKYLNQSSPPATQAQSNIDLNPPTQK